MVQKSKALLEARRDLIQHTIGKIREPCDFWEFKSHTFVVLLHLWLHVKANEEGLFDLDEWEHPELKECLIKKIESFLIKHIK
jgi:hypothetical protein